MAATLDGVAVLGVAVRIQDSLAPAERQTAAAFGVEGVFSLFGGTRGRALTIEGVFVGANITAIIAAEAILQTYIDGVGRVLVGEDGYIYSNVVITGPREWTGGYGRFGGSVARPYRIGAQGLTL